jgi:phage-related protein
MPKRNKKKVEDLFHHPRFWRYYRTDTGRSEVEEFIDSLSDYDAAAVLAEMEYVAQIGERAARKLHDEIYEVRAHGKDVIYRVFFATEGRWSQVLLALEAHEKKWDDARRSDIELAERRLADWRRQGVTLRAKQPSAKLKR